MILPNILDNNINLGTEFFKRSEETIRYVICCKVKQSEVAFIILSSSEIEANQSGL